MRKKLMENRKKYLYIALVLQYLKKKCLILFLIVSFPTQNDLFLIFL